MKSAEDKHNLVIDEQTAPIVQDIFRWKAEGLGNNIIARRLNDMGIPSPNKYRYEQGLIKNRQYADTLWLNSTIKSIIKNPMYIGCMSQGKQKTRLAQGLGPEQLTPDKWVNVENTHEPIISRELFDAVQELIQGVKAAYHEKAGKYAHIGNPENIFKGLVRCADCGVNLSRYKKVKTNMTKPPKLYYFHVCPTYERNQTRACKCRKSANEEMLIESVWNAIQAEIALCADTMELVRKIQRNGQSVSRTITMSERIAEVSRKTARLDALLSSLYNDYAEGILTESEYLFAKAKYREEKRLWQLKADELIAERAKHTETFVDENKWVAALLRFQHEKQLTGAILSELVDHIDVSENNKVGVVFKHRDEYEALLNFIAESEAVISA